MKFKVYLLLFFVFCFSFAKAQQKANPEFEKFAKVQDSLMVKAYEQKDTSAYIKLLTPFLVKYNALSKEDKQYYIGYYFNSFYNLSCAYALLNDKSKSIEFLQKSVKAGFVDYKHMNTDTDLENIRNEVDYQSILRSLKDTYDYLSIIKRAGAYNANENPILPSFTYQSADNPNLVALRKTFNLDSIAGQAGEVNKILNLLHWIHNLIPHDGTHDNPAIKNAMNMITVCKKDKRGLNCRGLATVLNECYLSLGIKSRFLTCMPKDSLGIDNDCHVIDMVYCNQLKKWLWIDPTTDSYVMNEKGELLSVEEVRVRMINDMPLILNPEANWNRKVAQSKEDYLYNYMAKNLYLLECPLSSEFDTETREAGKTISYLELIPLAYFNKSLEKTEVSYDNHKTILVTYRTNNSNIFWQAPN